MDDRSFAMTHYKEIEEHMVVSDIEGEENEKLVFYGDIDVEVNKYELCLVGRFLTEKNINNRAMMSKLVDVWKTSRK